jgi:protein gp37
LQPERLATPVRWQNSKITFVKSMSDLFHEASRPALSRRLRCRAACSVAHVSILTKRHQRLAELGVVLDWAPSVDRSLDRKRSIRPSRRSYPYRPAAVRFISAEALYKYIKA